MFLLRRPSTESIGRFIDSQSHLPFSYSETGATERQPPVGFVVDHNQIRIGDGKETYDRSVAALKGWRQFELGWVKAVPPDLPLEVGTTVAVQARALGVWSLSACRIVYVIREARKFGFAYGTLPDHVECGEERFTVEWREDDSVWYDILAFSRPHHPLAKFGRPLIRRWQKQFARESLAAMLAASH
jgi:uncharacterized protein (UPF0548 family)